MERHHRDSREPQHENLIGRQSKARQQRDRDLQIVAVVLRLRPEGKGDQVAQRQRGAEARDDERQPNDKAPILPAPCEAPAKPASAINAA